MENNHAIVVNEEPNLHAFLAFSLPKQYFSFPIFIHVCMQSFGITCIITSY